MAPFPIFATRRRTPRATRLRLRVFLASALASLIAAAPAGALPQGGQVVTGQAVITQPNGTTLQVQQLSSNVIINWQGFSVGLNELVRFLQPGVTSVAINRVIGGSPSQILGQITANGRIVLNNPTSITFGPGAMVNVGGLLATTLSLKDADALAGHYVFQQGSGSLGSIVNQGTITVPAGGFVTLSAPTVVNQGTITAQLGTVQLSSGRQLTVDFAGDGLVRFVVDGALAGQPLTADGRTLSVGVSNEGHIQADGGRVELTAKAASDVLASVVNNSGVIEARSLVNHGGVIRLEGSDPVANTGETGWQANLGKVQNAAGAVVNSGTLDVSAAEPRAAQGEVTLSGQAVGVSGSILARGAESAQGGRVLITSSDRTVVTSSSLTDTSGVDNSSAGNVVVWSDKNTTFRGTILARGGDRGGDGGHVEVSGHVGLGFSGSVDTGAPRGTVGTLLLDPRDLTITDAASGGTLDGSLPTIDFATGGTTETVSSGALAGLGNTTVLLRATGTITVGNLNAAPANGTLSFGASGANTVTFQTDATAGSGNITFQNTANTVSTAGGSISFLAGGTGTLTLGGIGTSGGGVTLQAGGGSSSVRAISAGGGAVTIQGVGDLTASGVISGAGTTLTQNGTGTLTLSGANTYTGATRINSGTLRLGAANAVGASSAVTVAGGATFNLNSNSDTIGSLAGGRDGDQRSGGCRDAHGRGGQHLDDVLGNHSERQRHDSVDQARHRHLHAEWRQYLHGDQHYQRRHVAVRPGWQPGRHRRRGPGQCRRRYAGPQ